MSSKFTNGWRAGLARHSSLVILLLLSLPAAGPLLQPGYFWGAHDARSAVYFLFQFDKAIQDGILYPRWAPDFAFGFGYPMFNIYPPLSSYAGEFFHLLGFGFTDAVKIVFGLSAILSGLTMYLFARRLLGERAGLIAGLVYVYLPYHLFDIYVRAALAESVAFVFIPLVMWAFFETAVAPSLKKILWGAVALAGLIFTHSALAILFTLVMGAFTAMLLLALPTAAGWQRIKKLGRSAIAPALTLALGLGLSAVFLLPALLEQKYVRLDQWQGGRYAFGKDFVDFFQLFSPRWGFGPSIAGPNDQTGFQVGLPALILFALSFFIVPRLKNRAVRLALYFCQGFVLIGLLLLLPQSRPVWETVRFIQAIQFPWRLFSLLAPAIALLGGIIVTDEDGQRSAVGGQLSAVLPLILLILLSSFPYLQAELRDPKPTEGPVDLAGMFRFQQSSDELTGSTAWVKQIPRWSSLADTAISGIEITSRVAQTEVWNADHTVPLMAVNSFEQDSAHEFVWVYAADDQQAVTFYMPYYPGWTATIYADSNPDRPDLYPHGRIGERVAELTWPDIRVTDPEGWMVVPVPAGEHFVELRFRDTPIRTAGKWISTLSLALVIIGQLSLVIAGKHVTSDKSTTVY